MQDSSPGVTITPKEQPGNIQLSQGQENAEPAGEEERVPLKVRFTEKESSDGNAVRKNTILKIKSDKCLPFSEIPKYTPFFANLDRLLHTQKPLPSEVLSEQKDTLPNPVTVMEAVSSIPSKTCLAVSTASGASHLNLASSSMTSTETHTTACCKQVTEDTREGSYLGSEPLLKLNARSKVLSTGYEELHLVARMPSSKVTQFLNGRPITLMAKCVDISSDRKLVQKQTPCVLKHRIHNQNYYSCSKITVAGSKRNQLRKRGTSEVKAALAQGSECENTISSPAVQLQTLADASIPYSLEDHKGKYPTKKKPDSDSSSGHVTRASSNSPVPCDEPASSLSVSASMLFLFLCPCLLIFLALFYILYKLSSSLLRLILWYLFKIASYPFKILWHIANYCRSLFHSRREDTQTPANTKPLPPKRDDQNREASATMNTEMSTDQFASFKTEDKPLKYFRENEPAVSRDNNTCTQEDTCACLEREENEETASIPLKAGLSSSKLLQILCPCFYILTLPFRHINEALHTLLKTLYMLVLSNLPAMNTMGRVLHSVPAYLRDRISSRM